MSNQSFLFPLSNTSMQSYSTESIKVYRIFKSLDAADPLGVVRHYEENESMLRTLDSAQAFDCLAAYADALFGAEMFEKHTTVAARLLEVIIIDNFTSYLGEDAYEHTLLRLACSHLHMGHKQQSQRLLEDLIKINPDNKAARQVLATILIREQPVWYRKWTNFYIGSLIIASFCFVLSLVSYVFELNITSVASYLGFACIVITLCAIVGTRSYHTWKSFAYTRRLARKLLLNKRKKSQQK
jgi:hypothetical protein